MLDRLLPRRDTLLRQTLTTTAITVFATVVVHSRWNSTPKGTPARGLLDIACHLGTAWAVLIPVLPKVRYRRAFSLTTLLSAVAIDLDHIVAARSLEMRSWQTMPSRPPTHSVIAMFSSALIIERLRPGQRLWLAILIGTGSHLLRDLATGGAPLWHPRRIVALPHTAVVGILALLTLTAWLLADLPLLRLPTSLKPVALDRVA